MGGPVGTLFWMLCDKLVRVHPRWKVLLWLMAIIAAVTLSECGTPSSCTSCKSGTGSLDGSVLVLSIYAAWQPANFATTVDLQSGHRVVASDHVGPSGEFHFTEVPGNYSLNVTSGLPTGCSETVAIRKGVASHVNLNCKT